MRLLRVLTVLVVSVLVFGVGGLAVAYMAVPTSTVGEVDFTRELRIPPLAGSRIEEGRRVFELTAAEGSAVLVDGESRKTWGFNGDYLGPTLRVRRGEELEVRVTNGLDESTSVHWHGMHLPAAMDGGPHQRVEPGETWSPGWRVDQPAATLWYHPHPHGETADHVQRGLAGMFIVDDEDAPANLPQKYGVDDIPVIVQDQRRSGGVDIQSAGLGDDIVVNGTYGPYLDVTTERVRLRLLNASTMRVYAFGFSDQRSFALVGTDGGLLPTPATMSRIRLSPGERAEVVVDMRAGEDVVLRSYAPDLESNFLAQRFNGGADEFDVLQLRAAEQLRPSPAVPEVLAPAPDLDTDAATVRSFELRGRRINDASMDMSRIDEIVELGETEIWDVRNGDGEHHNFHVHDVQFQVLDVEGEPPGPELSGWKDTIFLGPGDDVRLAMRFTDYADSDSPYMYHCHLLRHEDGGMMGQFVAVEPGHTASSPTHEHD